MESWIGLVMIEASLCPLTHSMCLTIEWYTSGKFVDSKLATEASTHLPT